ncbi:hypothetical protein C8R44DRAFT_845460 [Mycena epipterygia]|nr:hypothetical protein C8R44DRAFT_845460 [Mycena epipterygia]
MSTADAAATAAATLLALANPAPGPVPAPSAAKRKFDEIVDLLGVPPVVAGKRAKRSSLETKSPLEKLLSLAKYFVRAVHPFMDIGLVLFYGSQAHWAAPAPSVAGNSVTIPESQRAEQKRHVDAFDKMMAKSPDSLDVLREFYKDNMQWPRIVKRFREAAASARQNDTSGLKHKMKYVLSDATRVLVPALGESASKSDRGINHVMLRDEIIPWPLRIQINEVDDSDEPQATPKAMSALKALMTGRLTNGKPALTANKYPSCFYADDEYDPTDPERGLFRSEFILRVLRHLWTAPSSAMDLEVRLSPARTMLSTSDWATKDGNYNYVKLFDSIVALFETDPTDAWVVDTVKFLQAGMFGSGNAESASGSSDSDDEESEAAAILARRAARRTPASDPESLIATYNFASLNHRECHSRPLCPPYQYSESLHPSAEVNLMPPVQQQPSGPHRSLNIIHRLAILFSRRRAPCIITPAVFV